MHSVSLELILLLEREHREISPLGAPYIEVSCGVVSMVHPVWERGNARGSKLNVFLIV